MAANRTETGAQTPELPPVSTNNRGEFPIRIARDGTWYHEGTPIRRKALARLFSTVLQRDDAGRYWLATPFERGLIQVDDAPFTAVEMEVDGRGHYATIRFRTNFDEWIVAGADHPISVEQDPETGEPSPYIMVRDGLPALILRPVFYALAESGEEVEEAGRRMLRVWSGGVAFDLGTVE